MSGNALVDPSNPSLRSWVSGASDADGDFPIQNLPYGTLDGGPAVRIGNRALCLRDALDAGLFVKKLSSNDDFLMALDVAWLNGLAELEPEQLKMLRWNLAHFFAEGSPLRKQVEPLLRDADAAAEDAPFVVGDYTDFYASLHHATNHKRCVVFIRQHPVDLFGKP